MLLILTGVVSTTRNVKIQFEADASDAAGVRIASGAYSAGIAEVSKKIIFCSERRTYGAME